MNLFSLSETLSRVVLAFGNQLLQSTVFACVGGVLALALRNNSAKTRYWIWMAVSVKFLVPFSLLIGLGAHLHWSHAHAASFASTPVALEQVNMAFAYPLGVEPSLPVEIDSVRRSAELSPKSRIKRWSPIALTAIWTSGFIWVFLRWWIRWRRVFAFFRHGQFLGEGRELKALRRLEREPDGSVRCPLQIITSSQSIEPGVFGIFRPALIWPQGLSDRLDDGQLDAILTHEIWHVRRSDNLTAAMHMLVEAIFWIHPLVWWLGRQLSEERERACDEEVLRLLKCPDVYAESILKVCEFCVEFPISCISGVTSSDLRRRITNIMTEQVGLKLNLAKQLLLSTAALLAIAMPVVAGAMGSPLDSIQLPSHSGPVLSADDAAVSARDIGPSIAPTIETERSPQHALAPKVNGFQGDIAGDWQGTEQAVQGPLRIVVRVSKTGNGWSAVEYSLDQAARGVTCSEVTLKGTTFEYQVPSIGGAYKGRVSRDGKSIAGFWTQNNGPRQRDMVRATKDTAWEVPQPLPPDANPSFSVATIKPSDQSVPGGYFVARGRNFSVHSGSLALMIEFAYNVHIKQIVNGPDWMDQEKFDIAAISDLDGLPSIRQWSAMFQKLLTSRFGLTFHRDRRQLSVYALTVEKDGPKNLTLDASAATPPRLVFRTVSGVDFVPAKNAAMSDFAKALQEVVDRPVVDETGITGRYDFTLTWAAANYRSGHVSPTSEDQSSPPNLFNALREQLNLRLDAVEMPADVLIIDHVEQPSEN